MGDKETPSNCFLNSFVRIIVWFGQPIFILESQLYKLEQFLVSMLSSNESEDFQKIQNFAWFKRASMAELEEIKEKIDEAILSSPRGEEKKLELPRTASQI